MTWKTRICLVRDVPKGSSISYGRTFIAPRNMRVATLSAGYADGYPWHLSNRGAAVLVRGKRCPLLGRVTMDLMVIDVSGLDDVQVGDDVILMGRDAIRHSPCTLSLVCSVVCLGELFRDCLRMERLDSCFDDYAFPLQLADSHCPCVSRDHFSMKLGALGEDRLLNRILLHLPRVRGGKVFAGSADDCAIVETPRKQKISRAKNGLRCRRRAFCARNECLRRRMESNDASVERFRRGVSCAPVRANYAYCSRSKPKSRGCEGFIGGCARAANRFKVSIVGGETSNTSGPIAISVSVIGFVEKLRAASRRGGRSGDDLFVTGRLGGALKRKHLKFVARIAESRWLTKNFSIHAMMDLSDGLGADLPRLARASKVGFDIQLENLPVARGATIDNAISEGEDYELLFAVSPRDRNSLERRMATKISEVTADAHWLAQSQIANRKSQIAPWLRSFPTAPLKRKQSRGKSRRILWPVPYWRSKANWAAARPCSRRVSSRV